MNIDFAQILTAETQAAERLAGARTSARAQVLDAIAAVTEALTGPIPLAEKLCWSAKEAAARACAEGQATEAEAALIEDEAAMTGEDAAGLVGSILKNADAYRAVIAMLTGLRRAAEAAIDAAGDPGEVEKVAAAALERLDRSTPALTA